ncbi:hypothetical protein ACCAA_130161 [Candidatus Accumulibacter aalborgensis]|uniref:Uncharacterized protein n=1 Tax=Candidatus Accumulibacter aalborgensis TaxID=1860102 RepID=A0A1A8XGC7_9PROT|nr:hypothetical protein ACCAA_130161 [Candidatus Accumulibacter aalborgensis]
MRNTEILPESFLELLVKRPAIGESPAFPDLRQIGKEFVQRRQVGSSEECGLVWHTFPGGGWQPKCPIMHRMTKIVLLELFRTTEVRLDLAWQKRAPLLRAIMVTLFAGAKHIHRDRCASLRSAHATHRKYSGVV